MSLATKYRPSDFTDVVGQKVVTETLQSELEQNKVKHAYIFRGKTGAGKAQPLYSKLLTPNGYINMGDVKIGDEVFGEDGKPHKVIGVYPQGKKDVYELTFSDGAKCRCSDEHLWYISDDCKKSWKSIELKTIKDVPLKKNKSRYKYQIPMTHPIMFSNTELPLDPWLMGVLLGDGGFTDNAISVALYEEDIFNRVKFILETDGFELSLFSKNKPKIKDYRIKDTLFDGNTTKLSRENGIFGNRMMQKIYDLGLLGHRSEHKFIPKVFLYSSIENRIKLLQGLFDTDGYLNIGYGRNNTKRCNISYSTSSKQLAEDIVFLVQSLGGTCKCNEHETFYTYKGERKQGLNNFELYIKIPKNIKMFTSEKHNNKWVTPQLEPYRTIRNIEYIGEEECQCIMVDNPSHLYLTDNMIVTHNTTISRILANKLDSHIVEIDVASNNSAEAMRNLIQDVKNKPILHKYTVVILDEAHSASNQAMQALLKILEQPPKHLIFILCTTEGNKLPTTIYNRCEVFEFTPVSEELIQKRLRQVCELEHIEADETALSVIATLADGSVRQAIANLEQCTSAPKVTTQVVRQYLLADSYDGYLNTLYYILDKQLDLLMEKINQISNVEKFVNDFFNFVLDVNVYLRTKRMEFTTLPTIYKAEFDKMTNTDLAKIEILRDMLLDLQYEGRGSIIIKQLFLAVIFRFWEK